VRVGGKMLGEQAERETARAAAELEDAMRRAELAVLDQQPGGAVLVEGLRVLVRADAIVDASRLLSGEYRHG
jgi:hypothetical protein